MMDVYDVCVRVRIWIVFGFGKNRNNRIAHVNENKMFNCDQMSSVSYFISNFLQYIFFFEYILYVLLPTMHSSVIPYVLCGKIVHLHFTFAENSSFNPRLLIELSSSTVLHVANSRFFSSLLLLIVEFTDLERMWHAKESENDGKSSNLVQNRYVCACVRVYTRICNKRKPLPQTHKNI